MCWLHISKSADITANLLTMKWCYHRMSCCCSGGWLNCVIWFSCSLIFFFHLIFVCASTQTTALWLLECARKKNPNDWILFHLVLDSGSPIVRQNTQNMLLCQTSSYNSLLPSVRIVELDTYSALLMPEKKWCIYDMDFFTVIVLSLQKKVTEK